MILKNGCVIIIIRQNKSSRAVLRSRDADGKIEKELFFFDPNAVPLSNATYRGVLDHVITEIGEILK